MTENNKLTENFDLNMHARYLKEDEGPTRFKIFEKKRPPSVKIYFFFCSGTEFNRKL